MEEDNIVKNNKKKGKGGLLIVFILIILLAVAGYFAYNYFSSSPERVFKNAIEKVFLQADNAVIKVEEQDNFKSEMEMYADLKTGEEIDDILNGLKLKTVLYSNAEDRKIEGNISLEKTNEELAKLNLKFSEEELLLACKEIFDKSILLSKDMIEDFTEEFNISFENSENKEIDTQLVANRLKSILEENLAKQNYKTEKVEIDLNGANAKATKNSIVFTMEELVDFFKNIADDIKNDSELLANFGDDKDTIIDNLEDVIDNLEDLKEDVDDEYKLEVSIYTTGLMNTFAKFEAILFTEDACYGVEAYKTDEKAYLINAGFTMNSSNFEDADKFITLKIVDSNIDFKLNYMGLITVKATISETNNKVDMTFNVSVMGMGGTLYISEKIEENSKYEEYNFENPINVEELSEEDISKIQENFFNSKLGEFVMNIIENTSSQTTELEEEKFETNDIEEEEFETSDIEENEF